jgi:hypothetical protein
MPRTAEELSADLDSITDQDFNQDYYGVLDRMRVAADEILELPHPLDLAPHLFRLMERFPEEDFGSPGPIVHALEAMPGFELLLRESVARKPTQHTVWMVNRLLNSRLDDATRASWMQALEAVLQHPECDEAARESATEFLRYQRSL